MAWRKIKICITGGGGFIGTHLVKKLREKDNVEVVLFEGDLLKKEDIENFFNAHKDISKIIHLAGGFLGDFGKLFSINVLTTNNLLEEAVKFNIKKIIFTSTGAVYGEPLNGISNENDKLKPNTMYGLTKMYAEECIHYYAENFDMKYVILRFSNVYGPGNEKGVIYNFLKSIKENGKVTIFGTGAQKRNFLFVDDAVEAICSVLGYNGGNSTFNIADNKVYDLKEVVVILKNFDLNFTVEYEPGDKSNTLQVLSEDISKAKEVINWMPKVNTMDGIKNILDNFS